MASDPLSITAASIAAGVSAITVAALGVESQTILYAALGSALGIVGTEPLSRARTVWVFVATVIIGALLATAAARYWFGGDETARNIIAALTAPLYPMLRERIVHHAPALFDRLISRLPTGRSDRE